MVVCDVWCSYCSDQFTVQKRAQLGVITSSHPVQDFAHLSARFTQKSWLVVYYLVYTACGSPSYILHLIHSAVKRAYRCINTMSAWTALIKNTSAH